MSAIACLRSTTALKEVFLYEAQQAAMFEISEKLLTGRVVRQNPLPYYH
jgi:hypothetical protein